MKLINQEDLMKCKILTDITWQNYPWNDSPDPHPWAFPIDQVNKGQAHKCMTRFENVPVTIFSSRGVSDRNGNPCRKVGLIMRLNPHY